jgi:hypothetical protein
MRLQLTSLLAAIGLIILNGPAAKAVDIVAPAGLNPGDSFRFIFVTAATRNPTSSNIADYNAFVTADAAGYTFNSNPITWNAIGSTSSVAARDNVGGFNTNVPVYLVTGTKVADNLTTGTNGLWSNSLIAATNVKINGTTPASPYVWTGSANDGTALNPLGTSLVGLGDSSKKSNWLAFTADNRVINYSMIGLSNTLTIASVPEPSTYALCAIATGVMAAVARRRRKQANKTA